MQKRILTAGVQRGDLQQAVYKGIRYSSRKVTDGWMMFIDGKFIGISSKNPADYIADFVRGKPTESG